MKTNVKIIGKTLQGDSIILSLQDQGTTSLVHNIYVPASHEAELKLGDVFVLRLEKNEERKSN